jgi:crotonobetainyl-CoA:carnitine CoA-transferase CaiB-like acyl-CoA transferase
MPATDTNSTLAGIRVIELGTRTSCAWCARQFAGYGAEVLTPVVDHPLTREPPFDEAGNSVHARYFLGGRKHISTPDLQAALKKAHVAVVDDSTLQHLDYQISRLHRLNPQMLIVCLSAYGRAGSLKDKPGDDLSVAARSGWASVNGLQGKPPLKGSGFQTSMQAGTFSFGVTLAALIDQLVTSEGQVIDIAEFDVLASTFSPAPLRYQYSGFIWPRREVVDVNEGPVPVQDGYFALTISRPAFWIKAMRLLGLPDLADDPELQQPGLRGKFKDRFVDRVGEAMRGWKRMDLFNALGEQRVIAGPVLRMNELAENPQLEAREFLQPVGGERYDETRFPGGYACMSVSAWQRADGAAARVSVADFNTSRQIALTPVRSATGVAGKGPLAGVRGLVLTQAWAGTYATQLLGLLGADIIQLEVRDRLDSWRGTYQNPIPRRLEERASAEHSWNVSPLYNSVNLNKRCITLDLSEPAGVDLFKRLVAEADFVAENFSPRVMGNLGLDYTTLTGIRPDLIMASLSAYGAVGPWAHVPGIGGTIEPSSGMSALLGYPGDHPQNSGQMYPDPVAGLCGFAALTLALLHRDRNGEGQYIDLSMQEANFTFIGYDWLNYAITGTVPGPQGNRHSRLAPHGIFPCAGTDQWIALSIADDNQFALLATILRFDPGLWPDMAARKADEERLEQTIAGACSGFDKHELSERLLAVGICAAPVCNAAELLDQASLRDRESLVEVDHPEAGPAWQMGLPARLSKTPGGVTRPAPLQGQHSFEVFKALADMSVAEFESLEQQGLTGTGPTTRATIEKQA